MQSANCITRTASRASTINVVFRAMSLNSLEQLDAPIKELDRLELHILYVGNKQLSFTKTPAEARAFDIFQGLQLRCHDGPEMCPNLQGVLMNLPEYGEGKSNQIESKEPFNSSRRKWSGISSEVSTGNQLAPEHPDNALVG